MRKTLILACLVLSACGAIDPGVASRLREFSPLGVDPADLEAAVVLPAGLAVPPGGTTLTFGAVRADTGARAMETYVLEARPDAGNRTVFALSPRSADAFRRVQATVAQWEDTAPAETEGVFSISVATCRVGPGPAEDARLSVFVATEPGGPLCPLLVDVPLEEVARAAGGAVGADCP